MTAYRYYFEPMPTFQDAVVRFCEADPSAGERLFDVVDRFLQADGDNDDDDLCLRSNAERMFVLLEPTSGADDWLVLLEIGPADPPTDKMVAIGHAFRRAHRTGERTDILADFIRFAETSLGV